MHHHNHKGLPCALETGPSNKNPYHPVLSTNENFQHCAIKFPLFCARRELLTGQSMQLSKCEATEVRSVAMSHKMKHTDNTFVYI